MKRFVLFLIAAFCVPSLGWPSIIRIQSQTHTVTQGTTLHVKTDVTNQGDEPAHHIQLKTDFAGAAEASSVQDLLPVNGHFAASFEHSLQHLTAGQYPLILRILYTDANSYPFSILSITLIPVQSPPPPQVAGLMDSLNLQGQGQVHVKVKNLDDQAKTVHASLVLPQEISADPLSTDLSLAPHQETQVTFNVHNFSALQGSTYPVYTLLAYDLSGIHQTVLTSGVIRIETPETASPSKKPWIPGLIIGLGVILLLLNVRFKRHRS